MAEGGGRAEGAYVCKLAGFADDQLCAWEAYSSLRNNGAFVLELSPQEAVLLKRTLLSAGQQALGFHPGGRAPTPDWPLAYDLLHGAGHAVLSGFQRHLRTTKPGDPNSVEACASASAFALSLLTAGETTACRLNSRYVATGSPLSAPSCDSGLLSLSYAPPPSVGMEIRCGDRPWKMLQLRERHVAVMFGTCMKLISDGVINQTWRIVRVEQAPMSSLHFSLKAMPSMNLGARVRGFATIGEAATYDMVAPKEWLEQLKAGQRDPYAAPIADVRGATRGVALPGHRLLVNTDDVDYALSVGTPLWVMFGKEWYPATLSVAWDGAPVYTVCYAELDEEERLDFEALQSMLHSGLLAWGPGASKQEVPGGACLSEPQRAAAKEIVGILKMASDHTGRRIAKPFCTTPSRNKSPNYYTIIKSPIDLCSIAAFLEKQATYRSPWDFAFAIELVWTNAQLWYPPSKEAYSDADAMRTFFLYKYQSAFPSSPMPPARALHLGISGKYPPDILGGMPCAPSCPRKKPSAAAPAAAELADRDLSLSHKKIKLPPAHPPSIPLPPLPSFAELPPVGFNQCVLNIVSPEGVHMRVIIEHDAQLATALCGYASRKALRLETMEFRVCKDGRVLRPTDYPKTLQELGFSTEEWMFWAHC